MNNLINFIKNNEVFYRNEVFFRMKLENTLENKEIVEQFHDEIERKKEDFKNFNFYLLNEDRKVFFMNEKNRLKSIFISKKLYLGAVKSAALTNFYLKGFDFEKNKEITITITKEQDTFLFYTALLHKDLKCKAPLIEPNLRRNLGKWST
jgi:inorganic pyrophosphatase/exopolyphosphatase